MSFEKTRDPIPHEPAKRTLSLTNRLVWNLMLRQVVFVVGVNLLLIFLSLGCLLFWAEHRAVTAYQTIVTQGLPSPEISHWLKISDLEIVPLDRPPAGLAPPSSLSLPKDDSTPLRTWSVPIFSLEFQIEGNTYAVHVDLSSSLIALNLGGKILLFLELLLLFFSVFGHDRSIRRTLKPIQELAKTTLRLNSLEQLSQQEMEALAGQLDKIDIPHLDSRINLPATQRELQTLAQAINGMLDRISQAYAVQMQFVSDASHELRTPIAVIQGYSALLDRWGKTNPDTLQEAIDAIRGEAKTMAQLIEQLLFLARGDNQSQPVEKTRVELTALASQVLKEEEMLFPQHSLLPVWDEEISVMADPHLMKQLLRILMDNSLKYTPIHGRVWLKIQKNEKWVTLTVEDEGMGISAEALPHIFQRFYRTDKSRDRQTGGTGLGLSIAQWIVSQHNGWIEIISREDIGTRIQLFLPLGNL